MQPQLRALVSASGHTPADAEKILTTLNELGWDIRPLVKRKDAIKQQTET